MKRLALAISVALGFVACGGKSSPSGPSNSTTTTIPPSFPAITFTPDSATPVSNSYTVTMSSTSSGTFILAMNANNFTRAIHKVRGTLLFDPQVLADDNTYEQGPFMLQGNALTQFNISGSRGQLFIRIDRPDSVAGVTGSGVIIRQRFTVIGGVRNRTTPIQWTDTNAYTSSFSEVLARSYGGTVTIE